MLVGAACVAALSALSSPMELRRVRVPFWLVVAALLLVTAAVIVSLVIGDMADNLVPAGRFVLTLLGVPAILCVAVRSIDEARVLAAAYCVSAIVNAAVGLTDYLGLTTLQASFTEVVSLGRSAGLTTHPNHLAMVCVIAMPVLLGLSKTFPRQSWRIVSYLGMSILGAGVLVSGSRTGIVATALIFAGLGAIEKSLRTQIVVASLVGAALLMSLSAIGPQSDFSFAVDRLRGESTQYSNVNVADRERQTILEDSLEGIKRHPLTGEGFGVVRDAHNVGLQMLQSGGPLALLGFLVFCAGVVYTGASIWRRAEIPKEVRWLGLGLTFGSIAWFLGALGQNLIYDRFLYVPAGLTLAVAAVVHRNRGAPQSIANTSRFLQPPASATRAP